MFSQDENAIELLSEVIQSAVNQETVYNEAPPDLIDDADSVTGSAADGVNYLDKGPSNTQEHSAEHYNASDFTDLPNGTSDEPPGSTSNPTVYDKFYLRMALWAITFDITTKCWTSLVECLQSAVKGEENLSDCLIMLPVTLSILTGHLRRHLPLAKLYAKEVPVKRKTTDPQRPTIALLHYFNHSEIVKLLLETESVWKQMHFGAAKFATVRSEAWNRDAWAESIRAASAELPFYPQSSEAVFPSDTLLYCDNTSQIQMGRVLRIWTEHLQDDDSQWQWRLEIQLLNELPDKTWVLLEDCLHVVRPEQLMHRRRVLFPGPAEETDRSDTCPVEGKISCIQYKGSKQRPAFQRWRTLAEGEIMTYGRKYLQDNFVRRGSGRKIMVVPQFHYSDGFAIYRTMWKSSAGFYMIPANLPQHARRKQSNWRTLTLTPFGVEFKSAVECLAPASARLARGYTEVLHGNEEVFVSAFLLCGLGDMPQQSQSPGVKSLGADKPCPRCLIRKKDLHNLEYNLNLNSRYDDLMEYTQFRAQNAETARAAQAILNDYSLQDEACPWALCFPGMVPFRQFAVDVNHSELKGLCSLQ